MIAAVAIVGKMNNPMFMRSFNSTTDELKFHYIIHASLDLIEEGVASTTDQFLGMLYPSEDFKVYGYVTCTNVKFVIVIDSDTAEQSVKQFFEKLHCLYMDTISNPFYTIGDDIRSKTFECEVANLVALNS